MRSRRRLRSLVLLSIGAAGVFACTGTDEIAPSSGADASANDADATARRDGSTNGSTDASSDASEDVDATPPPTETSACIAYVTAYCERSAECGAGSSLAQCLQNAALCPEYFFAAGSTRTIEGMLACADTLRTQSCDERNAGIQPDCVAAGTLEAGEPCLSPAQCESQVCQGLHPGKSCGRCADTFAPNEACNANATKVCPKNETCSGGKCTPIVLPTSLPAGSKCTASSRCAEGTSCLAPLPNAKEGTCATLPAAGTSCTFVVGQTNPPWCAAPSYCKMSSKTQGTCTAPGKAGDACGTFTGSDVGATYATCEKDVYCRLDDGKPNGKCAAFVALGGTCTSKDACGSNGYCKLDAPDSGTCHAFAQLDETCGPVSTPANYTIVCAPGTLCQGVCRPPPGGRGADCVAPNSSCYSVLSCVDGTCEPIDEATCTADAGAPKDAGADGGDGGKK